MSVYWFYYRAIFRGVCHIKEEEEKIRIKALSDKEAEKEAIRLIKNLRDRAESSSTYKFIQLIKEVSCNIK
jgi:hypothetical protein